MSSIVGAVQIASALSQITGLEVSKWQIYRLAKRKQSPITRDAEGVMLSTTQADLLKWWSESPFAPIFAKQIERRRGGVQSADEETLRIFGVIGFDDLTDREFLSSIDRLEDPKTIRVLINSEGGAVLHGLAMYHALRSHSAKVEVEIVGVAASMASAIAMAGDKVSMAEDGLFMLHDPWVAAAGNADELRAAADMLEKHGESLAGLYVRKSGIEESRIREMMSQDGGEGVWLNAKEALELGFIDEILAPASAQMPELPAAALAKRITAGRRKPVKRPKKRKTGAKAMKYRKLAALLKAAIVAMVNAETTEGQVIEQVAEAMETEVDDVNKLVIDGEGDEPTAETLQAYAEVLDLDAKEVFAAAKKDGIKVDAPAPSAPPAPRQAIPAARAGNIDVAAAVRQELARQRTMRTQALEVGRRAGIPADPLAQIVNEAEDIESANDAMIRWLADPKNQAQITGANGSVTVGDDDRDKWMDGMSQWLIIKGGNARLIEAHRKTQGDNARLDAGQFRGFSLLDIARDVLEREGINVRGMSPRDIAKRVTAPRADGAGLGTRSDFPILLENVLHKMLLAAYETAPDQWRSFCGIGSVSDFREHPRLKLGQLARLDKLLESGEFKQLHFPDAQKESIKAETFGNIIGLSRQSIINDDVDAFSRLPVMLGRGAARSIEIDVFALLQLNGGLGPNLLDGTPLFDGTRNNIDTGGAPSVDRFEASRVLMAQQKDPSDQDFLNLRPDVFVGPIGLGAAARLAIDSQFDFSAETSGNDGQFMKPNIVRDLLSTVVDTPRLTGTRWYLFADPGIAPVIEVVFLEGMESPVIEAEQGFDYDGVRWNIKHDYGVGATDFRGAITNAGA